MEMCKSCKFYKRIVTFVKFSVENSESMIDMKFLIAIAFWEII